MDGRTYTSFGREIYRRASRRDLLPWRRMDAGNFATYRRLVKEIAGGVGAAVVFVDYYRMPESRFPIALEQDYDVLKQVAADAQALNIDAGRIAVMWDGAGGTMAPVVSILARDRNGPAIRSQVLLYPITGPDFENATYREFFGGPWLSRDEMKWFWKIYLPDQSSRSSIHASPLLATADQLRGLPPALIIMAEHDMLRQEGEDYAQKLTEAGEPSALKRYDSVIHNFMVLNVLAAAPPAKAAVLQAIGELRLRL